MKRNLMSYTMNALAAGAVALVVFMPNPAEIRAAFQYGQKQQLEQTQMPPEPEMDILPHPVASVARMAAPAVVSAPCNTTLQGKDDLFIRTCLPDFVRAIEEYDLAASQRKDAGLEVVANPKIEQKRSDVTRLCRQKWTGEQNGNLELDPDDCTRIISGIAY